MMKLIDISTPKHPNTFAMVDDEDFDRINAHKWFAYQKKDRKTIYASRKATVDGKRIAILMHREILGDGKHKIIDHRDQNGLNNQKENMRPATTSQNAFNAQWTFGREKTSKYRGVRRIKRSQREWWEARIRGGYLGTFLTEDLAYTAYLEAAQRIYGEFMPAELIEAQQAMGRARLAPMEQA